VPAADHSDCLCFIAPPDLLAYLVEHGTDEQREAALLTLASSASMRMRRLVITRLLRDPASASAALALLAPPTGEQLAVYDVAHGGQDALPGRKIRSEGEPAVSDAGVNEAYDGAHTTYDFYEQLFGRRSIDGAGMEVVSSVHYGVNFDNAFWNGSQMVYGDGSGRIFIPGGLTKSIDVIGHELTHGVTQYTAGLEYHSQPGALNESISDVFGSLIKQRTLGQTAEQADWLIGEGVLAPALGKALRSMKAPGTAFAGDNQPAHMRDYRDLPNDNNPRNDNGGVHINSGIPNHAFYLAATALGGNAWETAGKIWYVALTEELTPTADFRAAAEATMTAATRSFGSAERDSVASAWQAVGVL
jgi:Zn-dependent metalloprotease